MDSVAVRGRLCVSLGEKGSAQMRMLNRLTAVAAVACSTLAVAPVCADTILLVDFSPDTLGLPTTGPFNNIIPGFYCADSFTLLSDARAS